MKVKEIFYSIQGEGGRQGEASIFIRLAKCNLNCWFCDTDWTKGFEMSLEQIQKEIENFNCKWIVWTGGEPTLQLNDSILLYFRKLGYKQAIETNGTNKISKLIDYVTCSPKNEVSLKDLHNNFPNGVNEFRYPISNDVTIPSIKSLPYADNYFVSPIFTGQEKKRFELNEQNINKCIDFVLKNTDWKLSLQIHKILNIR